MQSMTIKGPQCEIKKEKIKQTVTVKKAKKIVKSTALMFEGTRK